MCENKNQPNQNLATLKDIGYWVWIAVVALSFLISYNYIYADDTVNIERIPYGIGFTIATMCGYFQYVLRNPTQTGASIVFNFLSIKEKIILLIGPIVMLCIIIFLGKQSSYWRAEADKEEMLKRQWQSQYLHITEMIDEFNQQTQRLTLAVQAMQQTQQQQTKELNNVLQNNQSWSDSPVPDDVSRLFKQRGNRTNPSKNSVSNHKSLPSGHAQGHQNQP